MRECSKVSDAQKGLWPGQIVVANRPLAHRPQMLSTSVSVLSREALLRIFLSKLFLSICGRKFCSQERPLKDL